MAKKFEELKIRVVMRAERVSRDRAQKIIAERYGKTAERGGKTAERGGKPAKGGPKKARPSVVYETNGETWMDAADFFSER